LETPDAYRSEPLEPAQEAPFSWRAVLEIVQALALAVVISVVLNAFVVQVTEVRQRSMDVTLLQSDRVLVSKVDYRIGSPRPGDIIVFQLPDVPIPYVKRVVAVGGETVELRSGRLFVNGQARDFVGVHGSTLPENPDLKYPLKIPDGYFFAMGDNRDGSLDSRSFGAQPETRILGKVILRFWPLDRLTFFDW
jgi:signal peptidase I